MHLLSRGLLLLFAACALGEASGANDASSPIKRAATNEAKGDPKYPLVSAASIANEDTVFGAKIDKKGYLYRGDNRPETKIFYEGFTAKGTVMDLNVQLSHGADTGFISITRSLKTATDQYSHGRTGSKTEIGYVYILDPDLVPDGHYIPNIKKGAAVALNAELAVGAKIPPEAIIGVYKHIPEKSSPIYIRNKVTYAGNKKWKLSVGERFVKCVDNVCKKFKTLTGNGAAVPAEAKGVDLEDGVKVVVDDAPVQAGEISEIEKKPEVENKPAKKPVDENKPAKKPVDEKQPAKKPVDEKKPAKKPAEPKGRADKEKWLKCLA
ncbi:hypothetical protein AAL_06179 [Moelleriella libera RCEF 2490]|uniref:Uncharacterized protein n=1 Tax=Moelleriella libera RCEF 2490 TaxID=1081109 RepID=A0A162IF79_9HYPO|nr:hypothetical protein AAL_06179 [Moelleriella libera RCEF 2490]